ncbi:uncharacterized protein LOC111921673 [Lactuca sativa]|uniref:Uncharacterized protein n=1 Tax=Lactuca sativa TaxID=4236 RepID=A0A9R1UEZ7_LACSA|nr:uncharacterized protein LOC111921673 [Lactuca sativa]XP_023773024.1 uncharacterized protein LOC111921673 [Lactuca sativa]KAJ0185909.1 hypothetical protein LSAT_V11C900458100 [Lactuca sativa]
MMKRMMPWSDDDDDSSSPDSDASDKDENPKKNKKIVSGGGSGSTKSRVESVKRKSKGIDFEALSQHGYRGGLSVLKVPPPKESDKDRDWSWSTGQGQDRRAANETEESYQDRQKTRAMLLEGEQLVHARTQKEKNLLSFSQKEKRKRDMGQASRGKSYVEEEKRLLRENGIYSGFDA